MNWRAIIEEDMEQGVSLPEDGLDEIIGPKEGGAGLLIRETGGGVQTNPDGSIDIMAGPNCGIRLNPSTGRIVIMAGELVTTAAIREANPNLVDRPMIKELEKTNERRTFVQEGNSTV
ncbi:hypothetical protein C0431_12230 [bacterium]|nr:hypothetical protein [bacterium]